MRIVMRITEGKKDSINRLVEIIKDFLPLTSYSDETITFKSIFKESNIQKYLGNCSIKKTSLKNGFTSLFRYHDRLPRTIIRKTVNSSVEYRKYIRNPLQQEEIENLIVCLKELGFDMSSELHQVKLDYALPRITVPPKQLLKNLQSHDLTPQISTEPLILFADGHFNESVRKAAERFEQEIRELSGLHELNERSLTNQAIKDFDIVNIESIKSENMDNFKEGYRFLAMGLMSSIRNIFSHSDEQPRSPEEAYEMLLFLNWMFRFLK